MYRVWYDDEAAWQKFLKTLMLGMQQYLDIEGKTERLLCYMDFPLVED